MRTNFIKPIIFIISFIVLLGIACGGSRPSDPTATSVVVQEEEEILQPTDTPARLSKPEETMPPLDEATEEPVAEPTQELLDEPEAYYVEWFDGDLSSYTYFLMSGDENKMDLFIDQGYLVFDLKGEYLFVYVLYDEYIYTDVQIEVLAENRAKNTNSISLICNYSERYGWYEFNVSNGGLYDIWIYSELDDGYNLLASGGSTNVRMGRDTNVYTAICRGNRLALYINGILEREFVDNKYNLKEGQVGFSVSSYNVLDILVEIDYFSISQP